jgi:mono/diheme cytochrome c family protein
MRWFFLILFLIAVMVAVASGPRGQRFTTPPFELFPDMDRQYKIKYQKPSDLFADGRGSHQPVAGTVPMGYNPPQTAEAAASITPPGYGHGTDYYNTGTFGDYYGDGFPKELTVDEALMSRGEQRYQINCSPCHGASGNGQGIVSKYWAIPPTANVTDARVTALPDGQIFWTITHGKGLMGPYNGTINVRDRWAIVAYVRALQGVAAAPASEPAPAVAEGGGN